MPWISLPGPQAYGLFFLLSPLLLCLVTGLLNKTSTPRLWKSNFQVCLKQKHWQKRTTSPSHLPEKTGKIKVYFLTSRVKQERLSCLLWVFLLLPSTAMRKRKHPSWGQRETDVAIWGLKCRPAGLCLHTKGKTHT